MARTNTRWLLARTFAGMLALATTLFGGHVPARAAEEAITQCGDDAQLSSVLAGGGTITFDCGPAVIPLSSTKIITVDTTIDGGGQITLSGGSARRLFEVGAGVSLTLRNMVLTEGFASGDGGAISNYGTLTLENSTIRNSESGQSGGAIVSYGPLTITASLLEGNRALNGGAVYPRWSAAQTTIVNSVLRANHATDPRDGWGGALLAWDGAPVTIRDSELYANRATIGGAIYNFPHSSLTLDGGTLHANAAKLGGGLYNGGTATLSNATLSGNQATRDGGGIFNFGGTATLANVTISSNGAGQDGGGIYSFGTTADLVNVTVSGNWAVRDGGGIYTDGSTGTLTNVTVNGNAAMHYGGGIYHYSASGQTLSLTNTIVANSPSGGNCYTNTDGLVAIGDANLSSDVSYCPLHYSPNLWLGPLADNGGPTLTHLPQLGSAAIDRGSGCPATDQRGATRPADPACDSGAVEAEAPLVP